MDENPENRNSLALKAVSKSLRPLIRLLIKLGINFKDFSEKAKRVYLEESVKILDEEKKETTASSLSVVSGIHRKETSSFLKTPENGTSDVPIRASAAMAVITEWIVNPDYKDSQGSPIPLDYGESSGGGKSFTGLSTQVTKDVRAKTLLDELIRLGLVNFESDIVTLKQEAFVPKADFNEKLAFFSKNISEHIHAAAENIQSEQPPYFERSAFHDGLSEEDIKKIDAMVREKGMNLLIEAYRMAEELAEKNQTDPDSKTGQITLGIFLNHGKKDDGE